MPSRVKGYGGATRIRSELAFDPTLGDGVTETWEGPRTAILSLYRQQRLLGYRCKARNAGAKWQFEIFIGRTEAAEQPIDRFTWDRDYIQQSIFNLPQAAVEAAKFTDQGLFISAADYRKAIEDSVTQGKANKWAADGLVVGPFLFDLLSRGVEAYEVERLVLRRTRSFSTNFTPRIVLEPLPVVYSTQGLIDTFDIPNEISAQFPKDPDKAFTPSGTRWGWKTRHDSSDQIPALGKVQEIKEWVFAAWSTGIYTFIVDIAEK
jgi:hypothetical protein